MRRLLFSFFSFLLLVPMCHAGEENQPDRRDSIMNATYARRRAMRERDSLRYHTMPHKKVTRIKGKKFLSVVKKSENSFSFDYKCYFQDEYQPELYRDSALFSLINEEFLIHHSEQPLYFNCLPYPIAPTDSCIKEAIFNAFSQHTLEQLEAQSERLGLFIYMYLICDQNNEYKSLCLEISPSIWEIIPQKELAKFYRIVKDSLEFGVIIPECYPRHPRREQYNCALKFIIDLHRHIGNSFTDEPRRYSLGILRL